MSPGTRVRYTQRYLASPPWRAWKAGEKWQNMRGVVAAESLPDTAPRGLVLVYWYDEQDRDACGGAGPTREWESDLEAIPDVS
jgi:hypothetical protein